MYLPCACVALPRSSPGVLPGRDASWVLWHSPAKGQNCPFAFYAHPPYVAIGILACPANNIQDAVFSLLQVLIALVTLLLCAWPLGYDGNPRMGSENDPISEFPLPLNDCAPSQEKSWSDPLRK